MHHAVLASPIAIASTQRTYSDGFNSNPPNVRGSSSRNIPASCIPSSTSGGSSYPASMRGAAACNSGINARARARQSAPDVPKPATGPVIAASFIRLLPRSSSSIDIPLGSSQYSPVAFASRMNRSRRQHV